MITYKIHNIQGNKILAACDKELVGKIIKDKDIEINVKESFYSKNKVKNNEFLEILDENFNSINLLGETTVNLAVEKGTVTKSNITTIGQVKHAVIISV